MEYQVVTVSAVKVFGTDFERAATKLAERVNEKIANGWKPQGGLSVGETQSTKEPFLMQAMVRDGEDDG